MTAPDEPCFFSVCHFTHVNCSCNEIVSSRPHFESINHPQFLMFDNAELHPLCFIANSSMIKNVLYRHFPC